jgi:hypothetical protein
MADPKIRIRKSSVPGKIPTVPQLDLGELAVNFYDGKVFLKQDQGAVGVGTRIIEVGAGSSVGKTIFVTAVGNDNNTGLNEKDAKATIKAASQLLKPGDTIKVYPGYYVEDNPIILPPNTAVEGTELRNCQVVSKNVNQDLFHVNNGVHITDLSFVGPPSTEGAAVVAFEPLAGVATDRFFDAARLIRLNLDFIAKETVGYITSTDYRSPTFTIPGGLNNRCAEDLKLILKAICHDITRGGNSKCVGAGKSYYTSDNTLQHIVGVKTETVDAIKYAVGIARSCINNVPWEENYQNEYFQVRDLAMQPDGDLGNTSVEGCANVVSAIYTCAGIVTTIIGQGLSVLGAGINTTYPGNWGNGANAINGGLYSVSTASYNNVTGIVTITAPGTTIKVGDTVTIRDLEFVCASGGNESTALFPSGNLGYRFKVLTAPSSSTFSAFVGTSTIPHTYVQGGTVVPAYGPGVGPITQGPYVRNCTNFVPDSIGMRIDGFNAEPGDQDDIGVTGTMSVDSYTQYNQGGIGVSITNGAYAQLVSIFTICDDVAIFTGSGGQCDITNSNSSFGNKGLVAIGVGDNESKSIYRLTGSIVADVPDESDTVVVSGIGSYRPYDGQVIYFGKLYYLLDSIQITDPGSGYTSPPTVTVSLPTGPDGVRAEASANITNGGLVGSIDVLASGSQYEVENPPTITITGGGGVGAAATAILQPIFYAVESATLPSAGISTITLRTVIDSPIGTGTTVYFFRQSLQIASSHSFEFVGSGTNIFTAKPALGGITIQENEVISRDGGIVVYTSTDQAGNFRIGDGVAVNQFTGTISGRDFDQSLLNTVTPLIIALDQL